MTQQDLTEEQVSIIRKVEKLLALANRKKGNEEEAAAAAAKAQEMLAVYNIDMAMVEQGSSGSGKREEQLVKGGVYHYQRDLWRAVAQLNFCVYFTSSRWRPREVKRRGGDGYTWTERVYALRHQHRVVGRTVNVRLTQSMSGYLEQAIERMVMERLGNDNNQRFSRWAVSYRKGAAQRIIEKVQDRREQLQEEEAKRQREAANRAARAGTSTATTLTLASVAQSERDANMDFLHGEGWSAKRAEQRRRAAEEAAAAEAAYAAWAVANPEEARKEEAKRRKEEEKFMARLMRQGGRGSRGGDDGLDHGAYWSGYDAAQAVGIDPQASSSTSGQRRLK